MFIICQNCHHENRSGARFCSRCRAALPTSQPAASLPASPPSRASPLQATRKVCPACGTANRMDAGFCSSCGRTFSQIASPRRIRRKRVVWFGSAAVLVGLTALAAMVLLSRTDGRSPASPTSTVVVVATVPIVAVAPLLTDAPTPTPVPSPTDALTPTPMAPNSPLNRSLLATVQILVPIDGERGRYSTGSGSVLTSKGHILTNYHVLVDTTTGELFNRLGEVFIAVSPLDLRGEPDIAYRAEILELRQADDLVLLQIVARSDDRPLPADFVMTRMPIGDSDTVRIGDELIILGYPGIGGESITLTRGSVSGFLDAEGWIKTDAEINPGNSGGAAVNPAGDLVGIPTAGTFDEEFPGKLGLVRPVNRARTLIDRALREAGETP